jgi:TetR/AcrR family transcriptional regulator, copper-responsive repressor
MSSKTGESMTEPRPPRPRGRPRGFEPQAALEAAMRVFWAEGYDGTSVDRLCRAMGMPRASLYQQFGDKEALFLAAVGHYGETRLGTVAAALGPRGRLGDDLRAFFAAVADLATAEPEAPGCLISCVLADAAGANPGFRAELDRRFTVLEARLAARLRSGRTELGRNAEPQALALVLASLARGLMLRARAGARREDLEEAGAAAVALVCRDRR